MLLAIKLTPFIILSYNVMISHNQFCPIEAVLTMIQTKVNSFLLALLVVCLVKHANVWPV